MLSNRLRDLMQPTTVVYIFPFLTIGLMASIFLVGGGIPNLFRTPVMLFAALTLSPILIQIYIMFTYVGGKVVGKYVQKGQHTTSSWDYVVQVEKGGWVEEFEVKFDVYRLLSVGDTYLGLGIHNYQVDVYEIPDVMAEQSLFEGLLEMSVDPKEKDSPFAMSLVEIKYHRSSSKKSRTLGYEVYDVKDNI